MLLVEPCTLPPDWRICEPLNDYDCPTCDFGGCRSDLVVIMPVSNYFFSTISCMTFDFDETRISVLITFLVNLSRSSSSEDLHMNRPAWSLCILALIWLLPKAVSPNNFEKYSNWLMIPAATSDSIFWTMLPPIPWMYAGTSTWASSSKE